MVPRSDPIQLLAAWRALAGDTSGRGWRVIEIASTRICVVHAGRQAPENNEVLLVGIDGLEMAPYAVLPRGKGFALALAHAVDSVPGRTWLALTKQTGGPVEMFSLMASDLANLLANPSLDDGVRAYSTFMNRIRAWQEFMKRDRADVLSAEEEIGLFGELFVLRDMLRSGVHATEAVESWVGPEDGLQDFIPGTGAIEVKTTIAPVGFLADITSLEQLDFSFRCPIHVAAVRLKPTTDGQTLPDVRDELMERMREEMGAANMFEGRLLSAGYVDANRDQYSRRFSMTELGYRLVEEASPRLTRANVHPSVQRARYTLDLDALRIVATSFHEIAEDFGVKPAWN